MNGFWDWLFAVIITITLGRWVVIEIFEIIEEIKKLRSGK